MIIQIVSPYFRTLLNLLDSLLTGLGLRKQRGFWGIVYDSATGQPLDPVIIKLIPVRAFSNIQTCISDMYGHYGFIADPGKYKIIAQKTNYVFPSQRITGNSDGIFKDLYHGEFFEIIGDSDVVAPNIPMDLIGVDWNQTAKKRFTRTHPNMSYLLRMIFAGIFWTGFGLVLVFIIKNLIESHGFFIGRSLKIIAAIYFFLFVLNFITPKKRLWGLILSSKNKKPLEHILIEASLKSQPEIILAKTRTLPDGRFLLRANRGKYLMTFKKTDKSGQPIIIGRKVVSIGKDSIFNQTCYVDV